MPKTAFVTGATGFVGLNLVDRLVDQGWHVVAMHRRSSDLTLLSRFKVERVIGDVVDKSSLDGIIPRRVDCVFHVAGNTSRWSRTHAEQLKVNVKGTRNMVRAALQAGVKCFVHTSSIVAYGLHGGVITEETPTRGTAAKLNYIRSKALAEREVRKGIALGLKAVILNPSNIMGAYDTSSWSRMFRLVKSGRMPAVPPGGGSFCHAREAALAHIAAAERGRLGQNYLLGGTQSTYLGLAREMSRMLGVRRRFVSMPPDLLNAYARVEEWVAPLFGREPDVTCDAIALLSQNSYCSSRKAEQELGYRNVPLEQMLRDCYGWMQSQRMFG
ncbi:MAG TPA: NAD-dependent epimerase/dehydratase family protein [Nevskiaceae bacterium]|nr:NAD-dependent epimerase/dehydratase family protein [Nevskiaceae bacterium]